MEILGRCWSPTFEPGEPKGDSERPWSTTQPSGRVAHGLVLEPDSIVLWLNLTTLCRANPGVFQYFTRCTLVLSHRRSHSVGWEVNGPQDVMYPQEPANTQTKSIRGQI